jgi:hypothetical protein
MTCHSSFLPRPAHEVAFQVIALLVGLAVQHRLDPTVVPRPLVIAGLRRLLDLPVDTRPLGGSAPDRPTT